MAFRPSSATRTPQRPPATAEGTAGAPGGLVWLDIQIASHLT
jgi:hypothetical protein